LLGLTLFALVGAMGWRWATRAHTGPVEVVAMALTGAMALVITLGSALAMAGAFVPFVLIGVIAVAALLAVPWRRRHDVDTLRRPRRADLWILGALILLGLGLRLPAMEAPLAGRDQGTYQLRADALVRTGEVEWTNAVIAHADAEASERAGAADVAGLYGADGRPGHADHYEGSYRAGAYLADRASGEVRPQFLHGYPALLGVAQLVGLRHGGLAILAALAAMLGLWCVARRLWPTGPWPHLAVAAYAVSPLAIWTARVSLTETPTAALYLGALLAVLVARDDGPGSTRALVWAAATLGALAFVRGNAWFNLPIVVVVILTRPPGPRNAWLPLATLVSLSVVGIASNFATSFPYVHDELRRLGLEGFADSAMASPARTAALLVGIAIAGVAVDMWLDRGGARLRSVLAKTAPALPIVLATAAAVAVVVYVRGRLDHDGPPFSRLDAAPPALGWPLIVLALLGLGAWVMARVHRGSPGEPRLAAAQRWGLALACIPALTLLIYARHSVPHATLYYYGRYLLPELWPAAILLALHALEVGRRWLLPVPRLIGVGLPTLGAIAVLAVPAYSLVTAPQTRLSEFEGADRVVSWLDARLEPGAVVIAGGEGWHQAHTYNHVGGALELGRGRTLLRYHSREAAYATMHELLVSRPAATGQPPPPVYVLVNEATKTRASKAHRKLEIGLDPGLFAPFVAQRVHRVELYVYRLTPSHGALPSRVTRDALRMGLVRVGVDPKARAHVVTRSAADLGVEAGRCLRPDAPLRVSLSDMGRPRGLGPVHLVVQLAAPGVPATSQPSVLIDGRPLHAAPRPSELATRRLTTLGPWLIDALPDAVELRAARRKGDGRCPWGSLHELRLLPLPMPAERSPPGDRVRLEPDDDLGHPIAGARWVTARALNRHRPNTTPEPEIEGTGMRLANHGTLHFAATELPPVHGRDVERLTTWTTVVTLLRSDPRGAARLTLRIDGRAVASFTPPVDAPGSWQSPPFELTRPDQRPKSRALRVELELHTEDPAGSVVVRDVAFFGPR